MEAEQLGMLLVALVELDERRRRRLVVRVGVEEALVQADGAVRVAHRVTRDASGIVQHAASFRGLPGEPGRRREQVHRQVRVSFLVVDSRELRDCPADDGCRGRRHPTLHGGLMRALSGLNGSRLRSACPSLLDQRDQRPEDGLGQPRSDSSVIVTSAASRSSSRRRRRSPEKGGGGCRPGRPFARRCRDCAAP